MSKEAGKRSKGLEILEKIKSEFPKDRAQRTLNLNDFIYLSFLKVCKDQTTPPSRLLDEVLSSFLDDVSPDWRRQNIEDLRELIKMSKKEK